MKYRGKCIRLIKSVEDLNRLAVNKKSVAFARSKTSIVYVKPAITFLQRQCSCVLRLIAFNSLYEYQKPTKKAFNWNIKKGK